jgi:hypothetical protein
MSRAAPAIKQIVISRALKGAATAGKNVLRLKALPDGSIVMDFDDGSSNLTPVTGKDEWSDVRGET